ncbi:MAG: hydratase [Pseudomonadota bacterium]
MSGSDLHALAERLLQALDRKQLVGLPSSQPDGLSLDQAYAVAQRLAQLRMARGERPLGWKIGFTNRSIWDRYGVHAPIWGPVWNGTGALLDGSSAHVSLASFSQPRLEPEIAFGFARAPEAGMSPAELQACLAWVAHGFEIVHTHYPDWRFTLTDTVADFALHGWMRVGPRVPVQDWPTLGADLATLQLELSCDGVVKDRGVGSVVLDGPLHALKQWIDAMAVTTPAWRVAAGEFVTTGTITDAWPLQPGQHWQTRLSDKRLSDLSLRTEA